MHALEQVNNQICPKSPFVNETGETVRKEVAEVPENVQDRRVQKTRKLLQDALIELVAEKGYEAVTVREILERANVGRSTFYSHFQDKDQLLRSVFERLDELFEQHRRQLVEAATGAAHLERADVTLSLFRFVGDHHRFFKAMLENRGYGIFVKPIYDYVFAHIHSLLTEPAHHQMFAQMHGPLQLPASQKMNGALESEVAAHYFTSAFMGILVWWVEKDRPCSPEEMDALLKRLALPGLGHVLRGGHAAKPQATAPRRTAGSRR